MPLFSVSNYCHIYNKYAILEEMKETLEALGMTDKEADIYLALRALGTAPASLVAKRTGLPRSTVQFLCQNMQRRGILSMVQRKNVFLFSADDTKRLFSLLEFQRGQLARKEEDLHRIVGELERLGHPDTTLPKVRFYEGEEGVAAAWDSVFEGVGQGGEIIGFVHPLQPAKDPASGALDSFVKRRKRKGIRMRCIATKSPMSELLRQGDAGAARTTFIMPEGSDASPSEIMVYGGKVCIVTVELGAVFATVIENRSIASLLRAVFESEWKALRR